MVGFKTKILGICVSSTLLGSILMSVIISPMHHITAQTLESVLHERSAFKTSPQIKLGGNLVGMVVDDYLNKVYVINEVANAVSVIDISFGNIANSIHVGQNPSAIALDVSSHKVYVANSDSGTVSVINGLNDTKEPNDIHVGNNPIAIAIDSISDKVYVANSNDNTVSVINGLNDTKEPNDIRLGEPNVGGLPYHNLRLWLLMNRAAAFT